MIFIIFVKNFYDWVKNNINKKVFLTFCKLIEKIEIDLIQTSEIIYNIK